MSAAYLMPLQSRPDKPAGIVGGEKKPPEIKRKDVVALAHIAAALDDLKNRFPDPMWRAALKKAVCAMHGVAVEIDGEHSFGIYSPEDGQ